MEGEEGDFGGTSANPSQIAAAQILLPPYGPQTVPAANKAQQFREAEANIQARENRLQAEKDIKDAVKELMPILWDTYRNQLKDPVEPLPDPDPFPFLAKDEKEDEDPNANIAAKTEENPNVNIAQASDLEVDEGDA